jgi:hypothetical protein
MLQSLQSGAFIVAFVIARKGLQYIKPLTVKLQTKSRDISLAHKEIADVTTCIEGLRSSAEATFMHWFEEADAIARTAGFEISVPRQCQRQTLRDNHPVNDSYYRASLAIPFLDHLLSQLNSRFEHGKLASAGLSLVPETLVRKTQAGFNVIPDGLQSLATLWYSDLPDNQGLEAEYNRWTTKWRKAQTDDGVELPATAAAALQECDPELYPNIHFGCHHI